MTNLEILCKTYLALIELWEKALPGNNASRVWAASRFIEKLIKEETRKVSIPLTEENKVIY